MLSWVMEAEALHEVARSIHKGRLSRQKKPMCKSHSVELKTGIR
jgi:hypothetical protein